MAANKRCGECTTCCMTTAVPELQKPAWLLCEHCRVGWGCGIYATRPASCRAFECAWLRDENLVDELRPDRCGVMLEVLDNTRVMTAVVDPARPDAWRHVALTRWLRKLVDDGHPIIVTAGPGSMPYKLIREREDVPEVDAVLRELARLPIARARVD